MPHELPAISWRTIELADDLREQGLRVVMPSLVGGVVEEPTTPRRAAALALEMASHRPARW